MQANKYLSRASSLISPAIKIEIQTSQGILGATRDERYLQTSPSSVDDSSMIQRPIYLSFKFDSESFPVLLDPKNDICLAKVDNVNSIQQSGNFS